MTIVEALQKVIEGQHLTQEEAASVMGEVMDGAATPAQIGALLVALRMKRETEDEITGFAQAMRERAVQVPVRRRPLTDTCGTGGDAVKTFNVSTAAAFIAAGAGANIAKHGNRSVTSLSGSADVLEQLGYPLDLPPEKVGQCLDEVGIAFLFAPSFHPAMKAALGPRREIKLRTVFNLLGPLTNPFRPEGQVMGIYDGTRALSIAQVLRNLGLKRAFVVFSLDGMDEISVTAPTLITELKNRHIHQWLFFPESVGIKKADPAAIRATSPKENADLLLRLFSNDLEGPVLDMAVLNAAAALVVSGIAEDFDQGIIMAREAVKSGAAKRKLNDLIDFASKQKSHS
ncbi:MAG: anthranilate phosphoribosyltransferase [Armatimonadetes bacterium]|nr:anthranilate phosphoribosyltransferase [Armatimonadota bacterium]MDW8122079.1 anthranilate phosphoribosyltransferase [Armatimonadota bacterium]